jgi:hypothetical protein
MNFFKSFLLVGAPIMPRIRLSGSLSADAGYFPNLE